MAFFVLAIMTLFADFPWLAKIFIFLFLVFLAWLFATPSKKEPPETVVNNEPVDDDLNDGLDEDLEDEKGDLEDDEDGGADEHLYYPFFEIEYEDAEGNVTTRKIAIKKFDGSMISAYCFLRDEERSFLATRIIDCVDVSTGEVVDGDLQEYVAKNYYSSIIPSKKFRYSDWQEFEYSSFSELPEEINGFDLNENLSIDFVSYREGEIKGEFHCGKVKASTSYAGVFSIALKDSAGRSFNVELDKIISVDGVDDIGRYIAMKFAETSDGKSLKMLNEFYTEIAILVYLVKADGLSITEKKRSFISDYLKLLGADISDDVFVKAAKKIKIDLSDFKKLVNSYSKKISDDKKSAFLSAAKSVVGFKEKAKPFGLAGLQYLESKIKV